MSELERAVEAVIRDCLGVKQGEDVLVICNPATRALGGALTNLPHWLRTRWTASRSASRPHGSA